MSPNVMKELPIIPITNDLRPRIRTPSLASTKPHLPVDNQITPEKMDHLWEHWNSVPQIAPSPLGGYSQSSHFDIQSSGASCRSFPVQVDSPLPSAPTSHTQENQAPPRPASPSLSTPRSAKRWGLFGPKKSKPESPCDASESLRGKSVTKKKSSKVLKKPAKFKSSPDLKALNDLSKVNANYPPVPQMPPPLPVTPRLAQTSPLTPKPAEIYAEDSGSPIYLTPDPNWDASQGDATLYFIPPPVELNGTMVSWQDGFSSIPRFVPQVQRRRAQTHISTAARQHMGSIDEHDASKSFLDLSIVPLSTAPLSLYSSG